MTRADPGSAAADSGSRYFAGTRLAIALRLANNSGITDETQYAQKRRYPRKKAHVPVELHVAGQSAPMRLDTADICAGGCYLETMFTLAVGTALDVVLWLGEKKFTARGEVVTCHPQFGNGLKFVGLTEADQKILQTYLDSLRDAE